jgi:hypothetical protein
MRPQSIIMFERLFLGSLAVSLVATALSFGDVLQVVTTDMQALGLGSGFLTSVLAVSFALYLLLWYLIAHKASTVAKWILVVFVALAVAFSIPGLFRASLDLVTVLNLAALALEVAAVTYLFRDDAKIWFKREPAVDPTTFD